MTLYITNILFFFLIKKFLLLCGWRDGSVWLRVFTAIAENPSSTASIPVGQLPTMVTPVPGESDAPDFCSTRTHVHVHRQIDTHPQLKTINLNFLLHPFIYSVSRKYP